ncbi:MAG: 3-phosphoshikimate 1-carboxyvinyltransferase [Phycisphaerales bacterium]|nr:3-phosphoshikimate 1-carboxyvinyltransferase [Phycisphaerales bacterium]
MHDALEMPDPLVIDAPARVAICPPGSKSITNRVLLLAALSRGTSIIQNALTDADDAQRMLTAIDTLGARVTQAPDGSLHIKGVAGRWKQPNAPARLNLGNAGTATRFLTAATLLADPDRPPLTIDGNERMRQRPIAELVDALRSIGARIDYQHNDGFPPLTVHPLLDPSASEVSFARTASGQYISAMMLLAPFLPDGLTTRFNEAPTSAAYIDMTLAVLRECGVNITGSPPDDVTIEPGGIEPFEFEVEPDASGAVPFWCAAALTKGLTVRTPGIRFTSSQSDARVPMVLRQIGASIEYDAGGCSVTGTGQLHAIDTDLSSMPDAAMSIAVVAAFAQGVSTLRGLRTLRVKETDRIAALHHELAKIEVEVEPFNTPDGDEAIRIVPPVGGLKPATDSDTIHFDTYDDHRMAMSMALVSLRRSHVVINDPDCVAKTYPAFWDDWETLYDAGA